MMPSQLQDLWDRDELKLTRSSRSQRHERETVNYDSFSVGLHLQSQGVRALHPVIMIPGVISTGLESWGTEKESIQYFRKRLWGSWSMMRALVLDKASWKRHIMLDKLTGLDPPGVKLRAAQGFGELWSLGISSAFVPHDELQDLWQVNSNVGSRSAAHVLLIEAIR